MRWMASGCSILAMTRVGSPAFLMILRGADDRRRASARRDRRDVVDAELQAHVEVAQVLRRQRGKVDAGAGEVDALVLLQRASDQDLAVDPSRFPVFRTERMMVPVVETESRGPS